MRKWAFLITGGLIMTGAAVLSSDDPVDTAVAAMFFWGLGFMEAALGTWINEY